MRHDYINAFEVVEGYQPVPYDLIDVMRGTGVPIVYHPCVCHGRPGAGCGSTIPYAPHWALYFFHYAQGGMRSHAPYMRKAYERLATDPEGRQALLTLLSCLPRAVDRWECVIAYSLGEILTPHEAERSLVDVTP